MVICANCVQDVVCPINRWTRLQELILFINFLHIFPYSCYGFWINRYKPDGFLDKPAWNIDLEMVKNHKEVWLMCRGYLWVVSEWYIAWKKMIWKKIWIQKFQFFFQIFDALVEKPLVGFKAVYSGLWWFFGLVPVWDRKSTSKLTQKWNMSKFKAPAL